LKAGSKGFEAVRKDYSGYNAADQKKGNLASALDTFDRPESAANRQN